ncbi:MAG: DUF362 domain-containing protein [Acidobacteriota bacterium]
MRSESRPMQRREFLHETLRLGSLSAAGAAAAACMTGRCRSADESRVMALDRSSGVAADPGLPELIVAHGDDPRALVRRALDELGGIARFVSRGDVVVVKPNIGWNRTPEQAANTNPDLVAEVVRMCMDAGAKKVIVTDVSCDDAEDCFYRSGIGVAAHAAGAEVVLPESRLFRKVRLKGEALGVWPVLEPFIMADKVINVPIAKHHSLTGVTLGMKNWLGILGGWRFRVHMGIQEKVVDLAESMQPALTIIDAYRVLLRNGPKGGNPKDVDLRKTLIASTDPVAADAWAAKAFWNLDHTRLPYLRLAQDRGLGKMNTEAVRTLTLKL